MLLLFYGTNVRNYFMYTYMKPKKKTTPEPTTYPAPIYPDVTTASPGPRKMHVKLNRLSRPVWTLSLNCTTTILVIVSPYYKQRKLTSTDARNVAIFTLNSLCTTLWVALWPTDAEYIYCSAVATEEATVIEAVRVNSTQETFRRSQRKFHAIFVACLRHCNDGCAL